MPQPTFLQSGGRSIVTFGGLALPNGQGTLTAIDLNDRTHTFAFLGDLAQSEDDNVQRGFAQVPYLGKGLWTYDDHGQRAIAIPSYYIEDGSHFLGQLLAALSQAGEQQLTFDNLTYIPAKYAGTSGRKQELGTKAWFYSLLFVAREPWFRDITATTATPWSPITTDAGQTANITYAGSVRGEPVFTLHVPNTNAVAINSIQLKNTMSGEFLTVNFLSASALPASTVRDVVIDCAAMTATCTQTGEAYDVSGSFPYLYPPAGQVNAFTAIITPASGASSGLTLAYSVNPRWQI